jgi:glycosyltransferase involved in cell wall biosynthesis/GT2 family glycosyltransferase
MAENKRGTCRRWSKPSAFPARIRDAESLYAACLGLTPYNVGVVRASGIDWAAMSSPSRRYLNFALARLQAMPVSTLVCRSLERLYARGIAAVWRVDPALLFDRPYYLSLYGDVVESGIDPLFHFLRYGSAEGRKPHPLFDTRYYLDRYPDVGRAGQNPLIHYLRFGGLEGRQPHPDFDGAFYLEQNVDVAAEKTNPLVHFLQHGAEEGRLPHPDFDPELYRVAHPDVAAATTDPILHFARHGAAEGGLSRLMFKANAPPESFLPVQNPRRHDCPERAIDVVIPVYKGVEETKACLASVLSSSCATEFRVLAVNDCSPEKDLADHLRVLARDQKITLIENSRNLGFVRSVNAGMRASDRDVVLLNSDTLVFDGWLDRLAACAYADERTGSVSPFSNNATICSYPEFCSDNELNPSLDRGSLDAVFATVNCGRSVEVPTTVGFCMYIRRACLQETGFFDAKAFGLGYGEENDFCMRSAAKGWKHKLACDVFVYHAGGVSFGQCSARQQNAMKVLIARHPQYPGMVHRHVQLDPANAYRIAATAHRIRNSGKRVFLSVVHALGGGVAQHVRDLAALTAEKVIWLNLKPLLPGGLVLECTEKGYQFSLTLDPQLEYQHLATVVEACGVERVHIHHLMGHALDVLRLAQDLRLPFDFTVHDYYTICPQVTLSDEHGRYCGEPERDGCDRCLAKRPIGGDSVDILSWRAKNAWSLRKADRVIAPSADTATRMAHYYPEARIIAAEHQSSKVSNIVIPKCLGSNDRLRVAVLGTMAIHKGFELLQQCALAARNSQLPLEFILVGSIELGLPGGEIAFSETGSYQAADLPAILERVAPHLVWFPARWPETFSYTLSACLELGLPLAAHNTGAFPERVGGRPWTWIVPRDWSSTEWTAFFLRIRREHFQPGSGPSLALTRPRALSDFYSRQYTVRDSVSVASPAVRRAGHSQPITIASTVSADRNGQIQACGYVRVIQPLTHPAVADTLRLALMQPAELATAEADVVLVQRTQIQDTELAERIVQSCRRRGSRLVFEIDDDLLNIPVQHPEYAKYVHAVKAASLLAQSADAIITSTEALRQKMLLHNANTVVLPNYLDERLWMPPFGARRPNSGPVRILYAGTISHGDDLEFLGRAVRNLDPRVRDNLQIEVVGVARGASGKWFKSIAVPQRSATSYPGFVHWIQSQNTWHWGVAPLLDTEFNQCKSALKFLEYSALGLPSICSDVSVFREVVRPEETGLLIANDPESWARALRQAVSDRELWARLHGRCRSVFDENTIAARAQTIKAVWTALATGQPLNRWDMRWAANERDQCR